MVHRALALFATSPLIVWAACSDSATCPPDGNCGCPEPVQLMDGPRIPALAHIDQNVSHDGTRVAFVAAESTGLFVLDLASGRQEFIDVQGMLPPDVRPLLCYSPQWCPYDNNRLMVRCLLSAGENSDVVISMDSKAIMRLTHPPYRAYYWLPTSHPGRDSFLVASMSSNLMQSMPDRQLSTLAVSMHKDGDQFQLLWEITLDGRIVRQLSRAG